MKIVNGQRVIGYGDEVRLDTTNFDDILGALDDTVQEALDTLDDHGHPGSDVTTVTTSFDAILSASDDTVQKALDTLDDHLHTAQTLANDGITPDSGTLTVLGTILVDIDAFALTGDSYGTNLDLEMSGTLTGNSNAYGNYIDLNVNIVNSGKTLGVSAQTARAILDGGTASSLNGQFSYARVNDGGTATSAFGHEAWCEVYAGGTITSGYGTKHFIGSWSTGVFTTSYGTLSEFWGDYTTAYGLYIDMDNITSGVKWGIFATGDAKSHLDGNLNLGSGTAYLNFGGTDGTGGYGIRDASGIMEIKNSGGDWTPFGLESEKSWGFSTPSGASGVFWIGGFYDFFSGDDDFDPSPVTFGTANSSYAAHFFVVLGANAVDEITITITGTTIDDNGTRTTSDTATIVIPSDAVVNDYFETPEKWIGQISIQKTAGTAKTCNYGFAKYWDNSNSDFIVTGLEATWLAGATDSGLDIQLHDHKTTGWTFNSGAEPDEPAPIASLVGDHSTEADAVNGEYGAWKRANLNTAVTGSGTGGTLIEVITTANRAIERGQFLLRIKNKTA
jgi:hypothetical protein